MVNVLYKKIKIGTCSGSINWIVILEDGTEIGFSEKPTKVVNEGYKHTRKYDEWTIQSGTIIMLEKGYAKWHFEDHFEFTLKQGYPLDASKMWGINNYGE